MDRSPAKIENLEGGIGGFLFQDNLAFLRLPPEHVQGKRGKRRIDPGPAPSFLRLILNSAIGFTPGARAFLVVEPPNPPRPFYFPGISGDSLKKPLHFRRESYV